MITKLTNPANPQFPTISDLPNDLHFRVGFSTMADGNMSFRVGAQGKVYENRLKFFAQEGIPANRMATFFTEHRDDITEMVKFPGHLDALRGQRLAITDAVVTKVPDSGVFLTFADCVPFIVYDRKQHIMTFAHIGWRSMTLHFTAKVLQHQMNNHRSKVEDLIAVIGPCIKKESYVFENPIQAKWPAWEPYLIPQPDGRWGIDLPGFCMAECGMAGLHPDQVFVEPMDTAADPSQFSHYMATEGGKPEKQGRLICYGYMG